MISNLKISTKLELVNGTYVYIESIGITCDPEEDYKGEEYAYISSREYRKRKITMTELQTMVKRIC